jgi:UDP-N-acetyl-D-glucosamine dehydrogenase
VIICGLAYKSDIEDMRDSPGFRILANLVKNNVTVATYDPYYSEELREKYIIENKLDEQASKFKVLDNLSKESIKEYGCLCVVQHHTKTKFDIQQIQKDKSIPFIYDCQGKLDDTNTIILKKFGS